MLPKISPECRAGQHTYCDVRWKDEGADLYMCDCSDGDCHQNADQLAELAEVEEELAA